MRLKDIKAIMPLDKYIWLDDETCEALGLIKNSFYRISRLVGLDELKIVKLEPFGVGGFLVKLDTRMKGAFYEGSRQLG